MLVVRYVIHFFKVFKHIIYIFIYFLKPKYNFVLLEFCSNTVLKVKSDFIFFVLSKTIYYMLHFCIKRVVLHTILILLSKNVLTGPDHLLASLTWIDQFENVP